VGLCRAARGRARGEGPRGCSRHGDSRRRRKRGSASTHNNRPVRRQGRTRCAGAAGRRSQSQRAVTGTTVLVARARALAQSPPRAPASPSESPEQPIGAARCRCAQRRIGIGGRGCSLGGRCGRIGHSARRRSALWRTRAAAAHVGRPRLRRDLLRLQPPRRPTSVGTVHVRTQRWQRTGVLREYCDHILPDSTRPLLRQYLPLHCGSMQAVPPLSAAHPAS
jgi:hypothetical protein